MLTFHQKKKNNNSDLKRNGIKDSLGFRLWLIVVCCVFRSCKLVYSFFEYSRIFLLWKHMTRRLIQKARRQIEKRMRPMTTKKTIHQALMCADELLPPPSRVSRETGILRQNSNKSK